MEVTKMFHDHEWLLIIGAALSAGFGICLHIMWEIFLDWLDGFRDRWHDRHSAAGRDALLAEAQADDDFADSLTGIPRVDAHAKTAASLAPEALDAEDAFTDGTGPQDAIEHEHVSGAGAMTAVPREQRGDYRYADGVLARPEFTRSVNDTGYHEDVYAIDDERSKWGFVPVRMGTPPHGMPIVNPYSQGYPPLPRRAIAPPPAMAALEADEERIARLLAKAEETFGPKADWDLLAEQVHHEREMVNA